jgi:predicted nuclease of predicted toxin-antitoxin system
MLRLLCNENLPRALVMALRALGHDADWIAETAPGLPDGEVLRRAAESGRVCVTFDKDFGELAAADPLSAACGIILLRVPTWPIEETAPRIAARIAARRDWPGNFAVMEPERLRLRPIGPRR